VRGKKEEGNLRAIKGIFIIGTRGLPGEKSESQDARKDGPDKRGKKNSKLGVTGCGAKS